MAIACLLSRSAQRHVLKNRDVILDHGGAKVVLCDTEFAPVVREALARCTVKPLVIDITATQDQADEVREQLAKIPGTLRTRVLY